MDGSGPAPREIEIKFDVAEDSLEAVRSALEGLGGSARTRVLRSTYYDTDDEALRRAGFGLRVREVDGRRIQTIKADDGGLFDRSEWEEPVEGPGPDLQAAARTPLCAVLQDEPLRPVFENHVTRTERVVDYAGGLIETALDEGEAEGHGRRAPVHQLELELKAGEPTALFELARRLAAAASLRLTFETKAEQGYRLASGAAPGAVKAASPVLTPDMTAGEAFRLTAAACLRQIVANEKVLRLYRRPEALHQMRVGLRRLRSAVSLFAPALEDPRLDELKAELRWLTKQLDETRDIDVFIAETFRPGAEALGREPGVALLGRRLLRLQNRAYDRTIKALNTPRAIALPLTLAEWLEAGAWRRAPADAAPPDRDRPVVDYAREALRRLRRKLKKKGAGFEKLSPETRHELRIAAKKLRYGLEFFAPLFPGKATDRFTRRLKVLQEALGALNDTAVARRIALQAATGQQAPELGFASGLVVGRRIRDEAGLLEQAGDALEVLVESPAPWRDI